jgi:tRNA-binding protein
MLIRRISPSCERGVPAPWRKGNARAKLPAHAPTLSLTSKRDIRKAVMEQISYEDFTKVDIRVGRIVQADDFPQAKKPAYRLRIDFGPAIGVKNSSAQITKYYDAKDLVGKLVLGVVNFPPRQIATFFSEVLTLGVILGEADICLVHPDRDVPLGSPIR